MDSLLEHDEDILRPPWGPYGRDLTLGVVSGLGKLLLRCLNSFSVAPADRERYRRLAMEREPGVGLLTYCNHTRCGGPQPRAHAAACGRLRSCMRRAGGAQTAPCAQRANAPAAALPSPGVQHVRPRPAERAAAVSCMGYMQSTHPPPSPLATLQHV